MRLNEHIFQIFFLITVAKCEVFTAVTDVEKLLHTHENVLSNLKQYLEVEENRLNVLKRYLKKFSDGHELINKDAQKYVENPINAFILIKRLSNDLEQLKTVASNRTELIWDQELLYPTEEDLMGAAEAIIRLQHFYKLDTKHLAEGNLKGVFGSPMSASDCYNLALMLYKKKGPHYYNSYSAQWFEAALEKLNTEPNENSFTATEIITYLVKSYHQAHISLDSKAYAWAEKLHDLEPDKVATDDVIEFYKIAVGQKRNNENDDMSDKYTVLCRSEIDVPAANASKLHCSYLRSNAFLRLAPIKMEEVYKDPNVFLYHDVLSDNEFEIIKNFAGPMLKRAKVSGTMPHFSDHRIGKNAWLHEGIDAAVAKVRRRTADFTGLSLSHSDDLQVLNYGIGGHYAFHYDASGDNECFGSHRGDRIATVLFYMSDVAQGGATVFAEVNLTVTPKKGTALFWENLHPSGKLDSRTIHAACPVLYGSKWVSNLWIHQAGQELSRPCPIVNGSEV